MTPAHAPDQGLIMVISVVVTFVALFFMGKLKPIQENHSRVSEVLGIYINAFLLSLLALFLAFHQGAISTLDGLPAGVGAGPIDFGTSAGSAGMTNLSVNIDIAQLIGRTVLYVARIELSLRDDLLVLLTLIGLVVVARVLRLMYRLVLLFDFVKDIWYRPAQQAVQLDSKSLDMSKGQEAIMEIAAHAIDRLFNPWNFITFFAAKIVIVYGAVGSCVVLISWWYKLIEIQWYSAVAVALTLANVCIIVATTILVFSDWIAAKARTVPRLALLA